MKANLMAYFQWGPVVQQYNLQIWEHVTCNLSIHDCIIYTLDHPDIIVCSFMEQSIGPKRVKQATQVVVFK